MRLAVSWPRAQALVSKHIPHEIDSVKCAFKLVVRFSSVLSEASYDLRTYMELFVALDEFCARVMWLELYLFPVIFYCFDVSL